MEGNSQFVMLQTVHQTGDMKADIKLDKICGNVVDITFNEDQNQYLATLKLIPNKNSAIVLQAIKEGDNFLLGTNN